MAKVPVSGTVKTRLHSILPPAKCAELATAFLQDTLEKSETVCKNLILAYSPASERKRLEDLIAPEIALVEQTGANLGERMANAFSYAFRKNSPVLMIGTDSPTFPADYLREAFSALENNAEIVLGKSRDGGFYLIGLREFFPELFDGIRWSTPRVFEQMTRKIEDLGIELKTLPEHYDVDTPEDFRALKEEIFGAETLRELAAKTHHWLTANRGII